MQEQAYPMHHDSARHWSHCAPVVELPEHELGLAETLAMDYHEPPGRASPMAHPKGAAAMTPW